MFVAVRAGVLPVTVCTIIRVKLMTAVRTNLVSVFRNDYICFFIVMLGEHNNSAVFEFDSISFVKSLASIFQFDDTVVTVLIRTVERTRTRLLGFRKLIAGEELDFLVTRQTGDSL